MLTLILPLLAATVDLVEVDANVARLETRAGYCTVTLASLPADVQEGDKVKVRYTDCTVKVD